MDKYIDNIETQKYGPKLRDNVEREFKTSSKQARAFLSYLVKQQAAADRRMAEGMAAARAAATKKSAAAAGKNPALKAARTLLDGLDKHLRSKAALGAWSGSRTEFFPRGLRGIGRAAADVASALRTARQALLQDKSVPERKALDLRLAEAEKVLGAELTRATAAQAKAQAGLSEQSAEKKQWRAAYRALSLAAEAVLVLEGRPQRLGAVVPHLAAPGRAKKAATKAKPAEAAAEVGA